MAEPQTQPVSGEQILSQIQQMCVEKGVSDIHFSPEREHVRVELRLHGMLTPLDPMTHEAYVQVLRKVKFESKLKLNVTDVPQDGQYIFASQDRQINVRSATLPSRFGETLTLRLLDPARGLRPLPELGFPQEFATKLEELANMPNGLILVTGPTGSGKTTTLYALLQGLIGKSRNIITLEDPIEYEIKGIVQSEIDKRKEYDFAKGLRAILRQDPDVILVGEIRDAETAKTALDASLTGHLVLSTLHTNSAIEAIHRLLSMGVAPYTFAPALRGILAQRLVRTLSDDVKQSGSYDPLNPASYSGQAALGELVTATDALRRLIVSGASEEELRKQAEQDGYVPMRTIGEQFVQQGITSREEVERVTG